MAYFQRHPFGPTGLELEFASLKAFIGNLLRSEKQQAYTAQDFMRSGGEEQTPDDHLNIIEAMNIALGGKDLREQ